MTVTAASHWTLHIAIGSVSSQLMFVDEGPEVGNDSPNPRRKLLSITKVKSLPIDLLKDVIHASCLEGAEDQSLFR
jgi:hypothetical protein